MTSQELNHSQSNTATILIIITSSLLAVMLLIFLGVIYLYRCFKLREDADQDTLPSIASKVVSILFSFYGTFVHILITYFLLYTYYYLSLSTAYTTPTRITQLVLSIVLTILCLILTFLHDNLYNLKFTNALLISARPQQAGFSIIKPCFFILMCAFSLKPEITKTQQIIFLAIIGCYSFQHMVRTAVTRSYFNPNLEAFNLLFKIGKTGCLVSFPFIAAFNYNLNDFWVVLLLMAPSMYGVAMFVKHLQEDRLFEKISVLGPASFKDPAELEFAFYLIMEYLNSEDPIMHARFQGMVLANEERVTEETQSYFTALGLAIKIHDRLIQEPEDESDDVNQSRVLLHAADGGDETGVTPSSNKNELNSFSDLQSEYAHAKTGSGHNTRSTISPSVLRSTAHGSREVRSKKSTFFVELRGATEVYADLIDARLEDLFQSGDNAGKRDRLIGSNSRYQVKINGIDLDLSNLPFAIKMIKLKYLYEVILKHAVQVFPENLTFLIIKAYMSMDLFQNKYLALTAITHVNVQSQKLGYKDNLICIISVNYFLKTILSKAGGINGQGADNHENMKGNGSHVSELDSSVLLDQSLKIDETINFIKECSAKITLFWQIAASESVSRDQITILQRTATEISTMLRHIRNYVKLMESIDSFQSQCQTLCFYMAHFFTLVIRDRNIGLNIFKQMSLLGAMGRKQHKVSLVDEVGVVVVDGNFSLYGKMVFANKIVLKLLGYRAEEVRGKLVHQLMPASIAEVHNLFWTSFAQVGIPKVLDSLRYLFVKDSKGYITPFKIFIKFQFSPKYGYSFVGLFRAPTGILFEEADPPVKLKKTYQMICNHQGKILELSDSCRELFRITPQILETLHAQLQENFLLSNFNPNLVINQMDFSKHSCVYFKSLVLNLVQLKQYAQTFEFNEQDQQQMNGDDPFSSTVDHFHGVKDSFKCMMKIVKETYGSSQSAIITLYYVIFTENQQVSQVMSSHAGESTALNEIGGAYQYTRDSANTGLQLGEARGKNSAQEENTSDIILGKNYSNSDSFLQASASVSSTGSSTGNNSTESDIKMVEEGIDYDKTPKPLIFLKISTFFLFISLITLASVQYGINNSQEADNIAYQKALFSTAQNQELISQMTLLTRTYQNIQNGFEPRSSSYVGDRLALIREQGLNFIEKIRYNLQELHVFFSMIQDDGDSRSQNSLNFKNVTMYSLLIEKELGVRTLSRFYSLNMWLVNLYECFIFDNFTSNVGTFLHMNATSTAKVTPSDQTLFFILINAEQHLKTQFGTFLNTAQDLIVSKVDYSIYLNQYYVGITSVLIVLLLSGSLYFIAVVLRFKSRVLTFFAEIDRKAMLVCAKTSHEFYKFLISDDPEMLDQSKQVLEAHLLERYEGKQQKVVMTASAISDNARQVHGKSGKKKEAAGLHAAFNVKKDLKKKLSSGGAVDPIKKKYGRNDSIEELKEEEDQEVESQSSMEDDPETKKKPNKKGSTIEVTVQENGVVKSSKKLSKTGKKGSSKKKAKDSAEKEHSEKYHQRLGQLQDSMEFAGNLKNKEIADKLQEQMVSEVTKISILAILAAIFFIAYFIIQLFLFSKNELQIKENSLLIRQVLESTECTEDFIYQVRKLQMSNVTWYDLSKLAEGKALSYIPTQTQANFLNLTYQACIKKNQQVDQWLQVYSNGQFYLNKNTSLCSKITYNESHSGSQAFSEASCQTIYQGVLKKTVLQAVSVFLQDSLYSAIRFLAPMTVRTDQYIRQQTSSPAQVDLVDAHSLYMQPALRAYYSEMISAMMNSLDQNVITAIFILFICVLVVSFLLIQCFLLQRIKVQFWHSFYILRLVPKDEVDRDFIKRINDYLSKA